MVNYVCKSFKKKRVNRAILKQNRKQDMTLILNIFSLSLHATSGARVFLSVAGFSSHLSNPKQTTLTVIDNDLQFL